MRHASASSQVQATGSMRLDNTGTRFELFWLPGRNFLSLLDVATIDVFVKRADDFCWSIGCRARTLSSILKEPGQTAQPIPSCRLPQFAMTLTRFVTKNAFRNKRRSILTVFSIGGSLLLLTFLITIWRSFYDSTPTEQSAQRLIVRIRCRWCSICRVITGRRFRPFRASKKWSTSSGLAGNIWMTSRTLFRAVRHRSAGNFEGLSRIQIARRSTGSLAT